MVWLKYVAMSVASAAVVLASATASAQEVPGEYKAVL